MVQIAAGGLVELFRVVTRFQLKGCCDHRKIVVLKSAVPVAEVQIVTTEAADSGWRSLW